MILSIAAVVFTFGIVIFLHEFGHFLVCKLIGIRVERFSFGFGPEIWGFDYGSTRYSFSAIPLGGYVKPAGESPDEVTGDPSEYFSKPWYSRLAVVCAGPFMNYVLAFVLFTGVIFMAGEPVPSTEPVIGELISGFPAQDAGLEKGDRITGINGMEVKTWNQLAKIIHGLPGKEITLSYRRQDMHKDITIVPRSDPARKIGLIGIAQEVTYRKVGFVKSIKMGAHQCYFWTAYTVVTLASKIYHKEKPDLAGPVGIVSMVSKAAHSGLANFIFLVGLISVAVGFFNLLPIPLLDGGHVVLYIIEGISRRKLTGKVMQAVNSVGLAILLGILVFATYSDVMRMKKPSSPANSSDANQKK